MIQVKFVPNLLEEQGRIYKELPFKAGKTARDYINDAGFTIDGYRVVSSFCATALSEDDLNLVIGDNEEIIVCQSIEDPVSALIAIIWAAIVAHPFIAAMIIISISLSIYQAVTMRGPSQPDFGRSGDGLDSGSPTYNWNGMQTTQNVGIPIPIVYGRHAVPCNKINEYIYTDGDKNYLCSLLCPSEGEIDGFEQVLINQNPYSNYQGVTVEYRTGTNDQSVITNFEDLHDINGVNVTLSYNVPFVYLTSLTDVEGFELHLIFPAGLYTQSTTDGSIQSNQIQYRVRYRLSGATTWTNLGTQTIDSKSRSSVRRIFRKVGLSKGQYEIEVMRLSADDSDAYHSSIFQLENVDEIRTDDLSYPNMSLVGIKALATEQLSGSPPNYQVYVRGIKVRVPKILYSIGGDEVPWEDYYYDPNYSVWRLLENDTELYWDEVSYVTKWSANPVWCIRDLITNNRYGLGSYIESNILDDVANLEMAKYCEEKVSDGNGGYEKRFRMDCVIDSANKAIDVIAQLCSSFRAVVLYASGNAIIKIDKPAISRQLFGMGNILADSYSEARKSLKDTYNVIDVTFSNKDKSYTEETIAVIDQESLSRGNPIRRKGIRVFTTKLSYALREGKYFLRVIKNVDRAITFKAGIDAIACTAFDVISFSHDVPQIGFSGRVKEGTINSIKLDRSVTIESGKTYELTIRAKNDAVVTRTVTNLPGLHKWLNVSSPFPFVPSSFDVYSFGEVNITKKDYRIVSLTREADFTVGISAIEYIPELYEDGDLVLIDDKYSALSFEIPVPTNLVLTELILQTSDGSIEDVIDVWFRKPIQSSFYIKQYDKAKIFLSDNGGLSWEYRGETYGENFRIIGGLTDLTTYKIAVVPVTAKGQELGITLSPQATIDLLGKTAPPSNVSGFEVFQQGNFLRFTWTPITDPDLARYVIKKGNDWNTGQIIGERIDATEFIYPVSEIGELTFLIKAIDTTGNESEIPGMDIISVISPPDMNFLTQFDLWSKDMRYILGNMSLIPTNKFNPDYDRPTLCLNTQQLWEELESSFATWELAEASGINLNSAVEVSGSYEEITPVDLQIIFEFKVVADINYDNVAGGSIEIQISTSEDGVTYSAFAEIDALATYRARYVKFKLVVTTSDTSHHIYIHSATIFLTAPVTKVAWLKDVLIPDTGKAIIWGADFSLPPRVTVQVVNGIVGFPVVDNKTADGCTVYVYNATGSPISTAEVDIDAKGY